MLILFHIFYIFFILFISSARRFAARQQLNAVDQFERLLRLVAPYIELKSLRKSGKMYQVRVRVRKV